MRCATLLTRSILLVLATVATHQASAVSINIGYQNPPIATWGVNFLWANQKLGFELGIGQISASSSNSDESHSSNLNIGGGINGKYFFATGNTFRPYIQLGVGLGLSSRVGDDSGAGIGTGNGYLGVGLMAGSEKFYGYISANTSSESHVFGQVGMGVGI